MGMLLHRHLMEQKITAEPVKTAPKAEEKAEEITPKSVKKAKKN